MPRKISTPPPPTPRTASSRSVGSGRSAAGPHYGYPVRASASSAMPWHGWHFDAVDDNSHERDFKAVWRIEAKAFTPAASAGPGSPPPAHPGSLAVLRATAVRAGSGCPPAPPLPVMGTSPSTGASGSAPTRAAGPSSAVRRLRSRCGWNRTPDPAGAGADGRAAAACPGAARTRRPQPQGPGIQPSRLASTVRPGPKARATQGRGALLWRSRSRMNRIVADDMLPN